MERVANKITGTATAWKSTFGKRLAGSLFVALTLAFLIQPGWAQPGRFGPDPPPPPGSLRNFPVPLPANLSNYVVDRQAAIVLGKALFWDH
ncbi:MAG: hypothetical protein LAO21_17425, partial [Acidobacteriia bacterium]|nr:hypothetical protein [Terriglobia bacterium]